jgi:pyruvate, orthophosphate dikinase
MDLRGRPEIMIPFVTCRRDDDLTDRRLPGRPDCAILGVDAFQVLDQLAVGGLITRTVVAGITVRPQLKVGICGEHGGEPRRVRFRHAIGLD